MKYCFADAPETGPIYDKVCQHIQTFTLVSHSSDLELHDRLDMVVGPFTIPQFCIHFG